MGEPPAGARNIGQSVEGGAWRGLDDLELATLEWVAWYDQRRIHHSNPGRVPPAEAEHFHYCQQQSTRLHETQGPPEPA